MTIAILLGLALFVAVDLAADLREPRAANSNAGPSWRARSRPLRIVAGVFLLVALLAELAWRALS